MGHHIRAHLFIRFAGAKHCVHCIHSTLRCCFTPSCLLPLVLPLASLFLFLSLASCQSVPSRLPLLQTLATWNLPYRTVPNSPDLSVVSHHSWTPGLLEAHGAARSVWKRRETRSTHLRYLYLCLTLPYPPYLTGPTYLYRPRPRPRPRLARVRHPTTRFVLARTRPFPSIRIHSGRMPPLQAQQLSH